ncbi:MAG TPA: hypothetical protein VLL52_15135 [Anaerolineae bacterium]|nr:hypothetical protein [Anaerolineae bacterium]
MTTWGWILGLLMDVSVVPLVDDLSFTTQADVSTPGGSCFWWWVLVIVV